MARLPAREKETAKGFLLDLFYCGGLIDANDLALGSKVSDRRGGMDAHGKEAQTICNEIQYRLFDFFEVDKALQALDGCKFIADPKLTGHWKYREGSVRQISRTPDKLAAMIADFCADNKIYWDDINTNKTVNELEQYKQTMFGQAPVREGCFLSQASSTKASSASTTVRQPRTPKASNQGPMNNYKQSGPQSGNARGLIGQPGAKITASNIRVYAVVGDNTKSTKGASAYALVNPLEAKGKSANDANVNRVFVNSSHGYTDCVCYFETPQEADAFLQKCQGICPSFVANLRVAKKSADRNGYFRVETDFGPALILAQKLNELMEQKAEEVAAKKASEPKYQITDIEAFDEALRKYE